MFIALWKNASFKLRTRKKTERHVTNEPTMTDASDYGSILADAADWTIRIEFVSPFFPLCCSLNDKGQFRTMHKVPSGADGGQSTQLSTSLFTARSLSASPAEKQRDAAVDKS